MSYDPHVKRAIDLSAALLACVVLAIPMIVVAVLIKCVDTGPVFFRQLRIGKDGKQFYCHKFRSMPVGTPNRQSADIGEIPMTWVGRMIRRANIDELPQLFSVIKGDMSLVGPRPAIPSQTDLLAMRSAHGVSGCLPGLTGLAQVSSYDGMTSATKAEFDRQYAENISFFGDLAIMLQTIPYLLSKPPIY